VAKEPWTFNQPLCAEVGVEFFYLEDKDDRSVVVSVGDYTVAKQICKSCIHSTECADWAIKHESFGFWGGLTPQERNVIRRRKGINVDGVAANLGY
jgi:hypothetical protein